MGLLFYRSALAGSIACLAAFPLERIYLSFLAGKRLEELLSGFRDALYSISGSVAAGRQMPSAIALAAESAGEARGQESDICRELNRISRDYAQSHSDIGVMLEDFGERSGIPEIRQFASSYRTCQQCGGDLEEVCLKSASLLLDKLGFRAETRSLISQKKLDVVLLTSMPPAILLMLNIIGYSYISVLYETAIGRVVMTICLLLIVCALLWGLRITKIEL